MYHRAKAIAALKVYSKPSKCGYNPYTAEWEDWTLNKTNKDIFHNYKLI